MFRRMRSRSATIVGAGRARPARAVDRPVAACPARRRGPRLPLLGQVPHPYAELVRERLEVFDAVPKQGYFGKICSDAFVGARLGARRIHPMLRGRRWLMPRLMRKSLTSRNQLTPVPPAAGVFLCPASARLTCHSRPFPSPQLASLRGVSISRRPTPIRAEESRGQYQDGRDAAARGSERERARRPMPSRFSSARTGCAARPGSPPPMHPCARCGIPAGRATPAEFDRDSGIVAPGAPRSWVLL